MKNERLEDPGYVERGDLLVTTVHDIMNLDATIVCPTSCSMRSRASRVAAIAAREDEKRKIVIMGWVPWIILLCHSKWRLTGIWGLRPV